MSARSSGRSQCPGHLQPGSRPSAVAPEDACRTAHCDRGLSAFLQTLRLPRSPFRHKTEASAVPCCVRRSGLGPWQCAHASLWRRRLQLRRVLTAGRRVPVWPPRPPPAGCVFRPWRSASRAACRVCSRGGRARLRPHPASRSLRVVQLSVRVDSVCRPSLFPVRLIFFFHVYFPARCCLYFHLIFFLFFFLPFG